LWAVLCICPCVGRGVKQREGRLAGATLTGFKSICFSAPHGSRASQGVKQREGRLEEQYKEETSRLGRVGVNSSLLQLAATWGGWVTPLVYQTRWLQLGMRGWDGAWTSLFRH